MRKSFNVWPPNNPGAIARLAALILAAANLIAAGLVLWPPGGSPAQLRRRESELRTQLAQGRMAVKQSTVLAEKIRTGREEGDDFLDEYFLPRRTAYSAVLDQLQQAAAEAKIKVKESAWSIEPVEGSDDFSMLQISANFEGAYADLLKFINLIDKSDGLLIIESLNATPQSGSNTLSIAMKLDTFVRDTAPSEVSLMK